MTTNRHFDWIAPLYGRIIRAPAVMREMLAAEGLAASLVTEDNTAWAIGVKA